MTDQPRGLEKLLADEVEKFGRDYVLGRTDQPERRLPPPPPVDRTIKAAPLGWTPDDDG